MNKLFGNINTEYFNQFYATKTSNRKSMKLCILVLFIIASIGNTHPVPIQDVKNTPQSLVEDAFQQESNQGESLSKVREKRFIWKVVERTGYERFKFPPFAKRNELGPVQVNTNDTTQNKTTTEEIDSTATTSTDEKKPETEEETGVEVTPKMITNTNDVTNSTTQATDGNKTDDNDEDDNNEDKTKPQDEENKKPDAENEVIESSSTKPPMVTRLYPTTSYTTQTYKPSTVKIFTQPPPSNISLKPERKKIKIQVVDEDTYEQIKWDSKDNHAFSHLNGDNYKPNTNSDPEEYANIHRNMTIFPFGRIHVDLCKH